MDKTNALLHEARIQADENRSKDVRHFSASVVEAVEELQGQLSDAEESNKAVKRALKDVDYRGTYAEGVLYLKQQLAAALAACESKDAALRECTRYSHVDLDFAEKAIAIKPDASALKAHYEALIERCANVCEEYQGSAETCAAAIRELKSQL